MAGQTDPISDAFREVKLLKHREYNRESDFTCAYDGWENTIQAVSDHSAVEINIPPEIGGRPVTAIGNNAFLGCSKLKWIRIPDTVKSIGNNAFKDCVSLKEGVLSASLEKIGAFAFSGCVSLKSLVLSNRLKRIEINSFRNCRKFSEARIKDMETGEIRDFVVACQSDNAIWMYLMAIMRACDPLSGYMDKYDATFLEVADEDDIYRIAVHRLRNPLGLTDEMEEIYRSRLRNMVKRVILMDRVERLTAIGDLDCIDENALESYIEIASKMGGGCVAYLLEYKYRKNRIGLSDFSL